LELAIVSNLASKIHSVQDAEYFARRRLPRFLYENYEAGSGLGITLRANVEAFEQVTFRPRAAVFFPHRDLRTRVLGHEISMPVIISSVGALRIGHPDGEVGVARAAGAAGTIQIVSTATASAIEDIAAAATGPIFYQLYYVGGRSGAKVMIDRAKRSGCQALVVNVDSPVRALRDRPVRQRTYTPAATTVSEVLRVLPQLISRPSWLLHFLRDGAPTQMPMGLRANGKPMSIFELFDAIFEQPPVWEDIPWIRKEWGGPVVIKGIINAEDARRAVDSGADAIVVSNHGGNSLDGTPATLRVLPEIVEAVGDQIEVWMDSGVRRGSDVVKAVALGAKAVLIGRAYVFALMAAGEPGVRQILKLFHDEIDQTLSFLGCSSIQSLDPTYVQLPPE
jgi:isopentenyl diphosphate isomerase/L-lactate dehydrogenase-like FMN-dependent dehydrogenase